MNRPLSFKTLGFVGLQTPRLSFTSRSESMEQATVTTLTATKEARSMKKKHSGNIFRYGKELLRTGVSKSRYFARSIAIKYSNFSRFYKKMGPFYKKFRCDKFGN